MSNILNLLKESYPDEYENNLKLHAVEEWADDYSMVVYEIEKQFQAIMDLIEKFEPDATFYLAHAIKEWPISGFEELNLKAFNDLEVISIDGLLTLHCDWSMVKHTYDQQLDSMETLVDKFDSSKTRILLRAITEWTLAGYEKRNSEIIDGLETFNMEACLELRCDWNMVLYEYDKQDDALSAL